MIYSMIRGLISLINGSPRRLLLHCIVGFSLGTSCGVVGLGPSGFLNPLSIIFYCYAGLVFLLAALKYTTWWRAGLTEPLPDGMVLLQLDHITGVERTERALLNARETTTYYNTQPVTFMPPAGGSQRVPVRCAACQQEVTFRVDSLAERKRRRIRAALIIGIGFLLSLGLEILLSDAFQPHPIPDWIGWVRFIGLILLVGFGASFAYLINYVGVIYINAVKGHRARPPEKNEEREFRSRMHAMAQQ